MSVTYPLHFHDMPQRILVLEAKQAAAQSKVCTFQPASRGAAYLHATGGGSSLSFLSRNTIWHQLRQTRMDFERALQDEEEGRTPPPRASTAVGALSARNSKYAGDEPRFMAPTESTGYHNAEVALSGTDAGLFEPFAEALPEWAAPRPLGAA